MVGSLVKRERRPLWAALSALLLAAIGVALFMGGRARERATTEAAKDAELTAQTELAPMLMPRDLMAPIVGERAAELTAAIKDQIVSTTDIGRVRIYSSLGRVLYSADPKIVGTRPSFLRDLSFQVANGDAQTQVHSGLLQTYVPIWLSPEGTVVVAEMSQAHGPITSRAAAPWTTLAFVSGVLLLGAITLTTLSSMARPSSAGPVEVYAPQAPARQPKELLAPAPNAPLYQHAGFRAIEEQRQAAEARAKAAEDNYRAVQKQLKETLAQVKDLEGRLALQESQTTTTDSELQALRDQLRETAERLHKAELDNNQLRERMALRHRELEEARHQIATIRAEGSDAAELKQRLVAAERRVADLARETERLEGELDHTKSKFHMSKLSEALREFEGEEDIEIDVDEDDLFEHPVVIRRDRMATDGKGR
jgi:hypothetical protein